MGFRCVARSEAAFAKWFGGHAGGVLRSEGCRLERVLFRLLERGRHAKVFGVSEACGGTLFKPQEHSQCGVWLF